MNKLFGKPLEQVKGRGEEQIEPMIHIETFDDLMGAFTRGFVPALDGPNQRRAFEIYRNTRLQGDSFALTPGHLDTLAYALQGHPHLGKEPLRNFRLQIQHRPYPLTGTLTGFVHLQVKNAEQIKKKLFQPGGRPPTPGEFKALYQKLAKERKRLRKASKEARAMAQQMIDLIHINGFYDSDLASGLKSYKGLERLNAFYKILQRRDLLAIELGHASFDEALQNLGIARPSGMPGDQRWLYATLQALENWIVKNAQVVKERSWPKTVRHLTIVETPLQNAPGDNHSFYSSMAKALDPNYHYFTLTDEEGYSRGYTTIVLGQAQNGVGEKIKVAFVDKVQDVEHIELPLMLEGVRRSVAERGYQLAIPEDLGDISGVASSALNRHFMKNKIKINPSKVFTEFRPHPRNNFYFPLRGYTHAEDGQRLRAVAPLRPTESSGENLGWKIYPGELTFSWKVASLDLEKITAATADLKNGDLEDKMRYIPSMRTLQKEKQQGRGDFEATLQTWLGNGKESFALRKRVLLDQWEQGGQSLAGLLEHFTLRDRMILLQGLLDHPRYRWRILKDRESLPHLMIKVRHSKKFKKDFLQEYPESKRQAILKILEDDSLTDAQATEALQSIARESGP